MKEIDVYFRPKVHKQFKKERFTFMPDIPIPHLDPYVLRPPNSIDLDTLDDKFPQFKKMDEQVTAAFEEFKNLPPIQSRHINDWLSITSHYGVPGFKPFLYPLEQMFTTPTKTESKLAKQRAMDLTSKELPIPKPIPRRTPDDLLKALMFGRKLSMAQKFRSERKEEEEGTDEEEVAEEGYRYDVYKPDKEEQVKMFDDGDLIYLDPAIFDMDRYKRKSLTLDEDD